MIAGPDSPTPDIFRNQVIQLYQPGESNSKPRRQTNNPTTLKNRGHPQHFKMARGNQRDKAREAAQKKQAGQVSNCLEGPPSRCACIQIIFTNWDLQKAGNNMSGTEMQRAKEKTAQLMKEKQAKGRSKNAHSLESNVENSV